MELVKKEELITKGVSRNSKFEALRIVCICMIVACHAAAHGINQQIEVTPDNYSWQIGVSRFFELLGDVGNNML